MLWFLGAAMVVAWVICLALKVTIGVVHILLVAGVIFFVLGFFRGSKQAVMP
jgi:hypothetical protein